MKCFKRIIYLSIVGLSIYSGIMFGMPYYRYYALKTDASGIIRFPVEQKDNRIALILARANELHIPINESGVTVTDSGENLKVTLAWTETVNILNIYKKNLDFTVRVGK